ncbi:hypothetical protein IQ274_10390 [Nostoc sp. LEGE 12447]|uniref:Effector-associated domain-containing protein n=2 Tax=Nostoc TaxID=1177 RepID=A0ABR8I7S4_9NOSO|nr:MULTISPECIES: hypothetical protein [Nostoc]MBD2562633.1 hypothetical protein [Nostoc linckia FACHB-391]MBD2647671.1 hypothetical protein [Nostoc foliaceum FACHB-393]MBE8998610.1 hypothetical protein [Nostoc sp. LEGE 12447]
MSSVRRLQAMYDSKQQEWDVVHERLTSLRQAKLIETDPGNQFKLDRQIKSIEQELGIIQQELTQFEQQLAQVRHEHKFQSQQDYSASNKSTSSLPTQPRYERANPDSSSNVLWTSLASLFIIAGLALMAAGIFMAAPNFQCGYCLGYFFAGLGMFLLGCLFWFFRKRRN